MTPQEQMAIEQLLAAEGTNAVPVDVQRHLTEDGFQAFCGAFNLEKTARVSDCGKFVYRTAVKVVGRLRVLAFAPTLAIAIGPAAIARLESVK